MVSHVIPSAAFGGFGGPFRLRPGTGGVSTKVQPFVSTVTNKLDAKARVSVPAPFRQILAAQETPGVYCFPSFSSPALEAFGSALIAEFQTRLAALDPFFSEDHDAQAQAVLAASQLLNFDDEGRVRIPDEFIAHAGIKERVTFVGMGRKFQMWDPDRFAPIERARIDRARKSRS
jgi:MraZ protein